MAVISESDLNELRAFQEDLMETQCRVERPAHGTAALDTGTGRVDPVALTLVYEGQCRISTTQGPQVTSVGEEVVAFQLVDIYIPHDAAMPQRDDLVTITVAADPELVGQTFAVTDVARTQYLTARKMSAIGTEPSRTFS